jgi:hypothetical protein
VTPALGDSEAVMKRRKKFTQAADWDRLATLPNQARLSIMRCLFHVSQMEEE